MSLPDHDTPLALSMLNPPHPFQLRKMKLSDIEAVVEIERQAFPTPIKVNLLQYELTENELAHYQVLVLNDSQVEPRVIGHGGYWVIADEVHVSTIAVEPAWRGRGLGELLLLNMLFMGNQQATHLATLEVRPSNVIAQSLYSKYQFKIVGERRRYYRDNGENALLMTVTPFDARYYQWLEERRLALFARLRYEA
jgi:ribosomal-protein-alanine N-acetyltransferase